MSSAWDRAKDLAEKQHNASTLFVRLQEDGDMVTAAFVGEPHAREVHWVDNKTIDCIDVGCEHCRVGMKKSFRVLFNLFVPADGAMKIVEGAAKFFQAVLDAREKHGLEGHLFEIARVGKGKETRYSVEPKQPIDAALAQTLRAVGTHALADVGKARDTAPTIPAPPASRRASDSQVDPLADTQRLSGLPF